MVSGRYVDTLSEKQWQKLRAEQDRHGKEASAFYRRNKSRLLRNPKYRNRFIAIRDRRVVDVDRSMEALADRLMQRYQDEKFYVVQVLKVEPVLHISGLVAVE